MGHVTESIFSGSRVTRPMADVQHIEMHFNSCDLANGARKGDLSGYCIITKHTKWDIDADCWANNIYLSKEEGDRFMVAWCMYRHELEKDSLTVDLK